MADRVHMPEMSLRSPQAQLSGYRRSRCTGGGPGVSGGYGATSSFGALMTAAGGSGGQGATSGSSGSGGAAGTETGAIFYPNNAGNDGGQGGAPGINFSIGGWGGGVWRGSQGDSPLGGGGSGPGGGGAAAAAAVPVPEMMGIQDLSLFTTKRSP